jgi:hypothetical protein
MSPTREEVVCPSPVPTTQNHRAACLLYRGRIDFVCVRSHVASLPCTEKKAARHRTRAVRTSENSVKAKFAEFLFHALGRISPARSVSDWAGGVDSRARGMENGYGCCPVCGANDGYLDFVEKQGFYCSVH